MGSAVPRTRFTTRDLPEADQFDAWRDTISVIFDVARIGGPGATSFEARVTAYQIGNLVITDSKQGEQAYAITPKRIRRSHIDLIQVGFYRSGGYSGDANGQSIQGKTGDVQILDLAQPIHSIEPASAMVCVFMPREILQERIGDLDSLHGADLEPKANRLLADYLGLLAEQLPYMSAADGNVAAGSTLEMISAGLRPTTKLLRDAQLPIRQVMLHRAKQVIETNLRSPQLTPGSVCLALAMSRRSLYRLFEPLGGIHGYILRRRLTRIMRAIQEPEGNARIADVAASYGFSCHETFWRAFRRHYGITPGDARQLHAANRGSSHHYNDGFDEWLRRISQ